MINNPFSGYNVELPETYGEKIRSYCATSGNRISSEAAPFDRQVDFWFSAFIIATIEQLSAVRPTQTYNATQAHILSSNPERIAYIQAVYLAETNNLDALADPREVWDFASKRAHAGVPRLIQILSDTDQKPIWNLLDNIESSMQKN